MAMDADSMAEKIVAEFTAQGFIWSADAAMLLLWAKAIATAVIAEITANAEVNGGACAPDGPIAGGKVS